jgi:hypothetical protein
MLEITSGALARLPLLYSETLCSTIEPQHPYGLATQSATWKELWEVIPIGSLDGAQNTWVKIPSRVVRAFSLNAGHRRVRSHHLEFVRRKRGRAIADIQ